MTQSISQNLLRLAALLLEGKNFIPVVFHADDGPAFGFGFVECLVKLAHRGGAVVGILTCGIGVVHEEHEAGSGAGGCPLEHLLVAVGVAEGGDRTFANVIVDADGFAGAVVDEADLRQAHDDGATVLCLKLRFHGGAYDLIGWDTVGLSCPWTHESNLAAGDDEGLEVVRA